ncbi:hypothetical protein W03_00220 [Nitrosomonas sp. PY1]|uniref:hypothetical protein n=1 Tax=Nitrosomonas sp. PY1 TaxID=1803906 RepID=UPI001FC88881|nr:hypothetical protein [Nitrosomonas sp. PY1]GKS68018.1 hypothetical protein W03_00220 [Nitrosomonas sp. PY1]
MSELINKALNFISANILMGREWLEVLLILAPAIALLVIVFVLCFRIKNRNGRKLALLACIVVALTYLPYELLRQSTQIDRANVNIKEVQIKLQDLLNSANLHHTNILVAGDTDVSANVLDDMLHGMDTNKKKDLIFVSWLLSENEKNSQNQIDNKQQQFQRSFASDIKAHLNESKMQIIASQPPVEKISESLEKRLDNEINQMISEKMQNFKLEIDKSLDHFRNNVNNFVQSELSNYQEKLSDITQKNIDELRDYSNKANQAFAEQVNKTNKESLQKLDATKQTVEGIGARIDEADLKKIAKYVNNLAISIDHAQKKADILFDYNECMRATGMLDLSGKEIHCKNKLKQEISNLN